LDLTIRHDGYSQGDLRAKRKRNAALIESALREDPHNPYLHFQAGVEEEIDQRWTSACGYFASALHFVGDQGKPYSHALAYRYLHALTRAGQINDALSWGLRFCERWPDSSDIHFAFGNACLDAAVRDPGNALNTWLPAAEAAWKTCLKIGENIQYESHVSGRGSYLAAQNLAILYGGVGKYSRSIPANR
jgi:hypothetical protein